jgi:protein gp37
VTDHATAIEWTHAPGYKGETWNPVTGCDRVSPGCAHCYALGLAAKLKRWGQDRYQIDGDPKSSGPGFGLTLHEDLLEKPMGWRKPRMVFVNSMSDVFHEGIPAEFIARIFGTMANRSIWAPEHRFLVLTKREERMHELLNHPEFQRQVRLASGNTGTEWPLPTVWLGVTIENRRFAHRADLLRETPAAVRFISAEPLLGPLVYDSVGAAGPCWADDSRADELDLTNIDWLIVGGESGSGHRRIDPQWVRDLRDEALAECLCCGRCPVGECQQIDSGDREPSRTAFFFKQWGGARATSGGRELDGRTWSEWPEQLPEAVAA